MTDALADDAVDTLAFLAACSPEQMFSADVLALVAALRSERTQRREAERAKAMAFQELQEERRTVSRVLAELERERTQTRDLSTAMQTLLDRCPDCGGSGVIHRESWFSNEIPEGHECETCYACDRCGPSREVFEAARAALSTQEESK